MHLGKVVTHPRKFDSIKALGQQLDALPERVHLRANHETRCRAVVFNVVQPVVL